ncbi:hypothetical protein AAG906_022566 [Vitis piasezkii]
MPSFPGGLDPWGKPNFRRKKERNFTSSFVDDGLLEIIGFRDSWHAEKFLPLNCHGTRLAHDSTHGSLALKACTKFALSFAKG